MADDDRTIRFSSPNPAQAERIYESYRRDALPDSPRTPFSELTEAERKSWTDIRRKVTLVISVEDVDIGFMTIICRDGKVNFGFGVFQEHRRQGHMTRVIPRAMEFIRARHPGARIFSSTEAANEPARRFLESTGFEFVEDEIRGEDRYRKYELPWPVPERSGETVADPLAEPRKPSS